MAHPLVGKYESTDLTALGPEDRVFARTEIKDALSGKSKAKLSPEDRVILLRLWMETFERQAQPATASEIANGPAATPNARPVTTSTRRIPSVPVPKFTTVKAIFRALSILRLPDIIFICIGAAITVAVIMLGAHSMGEAHRIEDVKREAEAVVAWLKENGGDKRAEENFQPAGCSKTGTETWKGCIAALTAEDGPFANKKSAFEKSREFFAPKCDMTNPDTVGTIIIERGAVPLGSTSLSYSAFDGSESLAKDLTIRVIVCGRGFHLIKVATELTF
jgi:hypothetical protein